METALYLLPVTLGDTPIEKVLPSYNKEIISGIRYFIVEDIRSARRFLKKVDKERRGVRLLLIRERMWWLLHSVKS